jgi:hypothetical protein
MAVGVLGMRGAGSFAADERPQNWRQMILLMFPNGDAPLTALLSKLAEDPTDDPRFHWFEKGLPVQRARLRGASETENALPGLDLDITVPTTPAGITIALRVQPEGGAEGDLTWVKPGHLLYNERTEEVYLVTGIGAGFINVQRNIGPKFIDFTSPAVTILSDAATGDFVSVIGNGFPEGADVGEVVSGQPLSQFNLTQIFRTPLSLTRTARRTRLRWDKTGPYMEAKREALQIHSVELEKALMFGERSENTALTLGTGSAGAGLTTVTSGRPLRTTRGLLNWLPQAVAITGADSSGYSNTAAPAIHWDLVWNGNVVTELIMDQWLEETFRFGSSEKLCFAGSTALNVLNQMAKNKMTIQAVPTDRTYGMQFNRYTTPFGDLLLKQHPLMSHNGTWRQDLMVIDPGQLKLRVLDDTTFLRNRQNPGVDASIDEFLTEVGLECRFSGRTADSAGGLSASQGPSVHGRLKGLATYGG